MAGLLLAQNLLSLGLGVRPDILTFATISIRPDTNGFSLSGRSIRNAISRQAFSLEKRDKNVSIKRCANCKNKSSHSKSFKILKGKILRDRSGQKRLRKISTKITLLNYKIFEVKIINRSETPTRSNFYAKFSNNTKMCYFRW